MTAPDPRVVAAALDWADEHVAGLDIAADCEARIQASYAPEMAEWEALMASKAARPDALSRMARNFVEAKTNERRFRKEAANMRTLIATIRAHLEPRQ